MILFCCCTIRDRVSLVRLDMAVRLLRLVMAVRLLRLVWRFKPDQGGHGGYCGQPIRVVNLVANQLLTDQIKTN